MAATAKRDRFNNQSLGRPLNTLVKEARILMVGAGGIGCELLKNLVLAGFGEIHIVDLDTIDLSNLNRQFLFRHEHIKKSKALVAKEAAHRFNPKVKLEAHHANIKDAQFNVDWFKGFNVVFNALDNLDARRHVNKMCIAGDLPLIESGTTGFNGQVQVIKKGLTACYDCTPKETPKSFPICTIRSTPSQPIHCIVWGKSYLLNEVFGASEEEAAEVDNSEDSDNAKEIEKLRLEAQALKKIKGAMGTEPFPHLLFDKVYKEDVLRLRSMEEMWKTRRAPEPLDYSEIAEKATAIDVSAVLKADQRSWTLEENVVVFRDSLERLSKRMADMKSSTTDSDPVITFDKDDEDTLDFVTASANLRSIIFGIDTKSRFDVKQMAGNIIPAIATTNAIVAGLCVLESFKVLRGDYSAGKEVFLSPFASERLLASDKSEAPNPECAVCSVAHSRVLVDMSRATLSDLVEKFLRLVLGYGEEITVNHGDGLLYDIDETENLDKKLSELGIKDDSFLTIIDDDEENPRVNLVLNVREMTVSEGDPIKSLDIPMINGDAPASPGIPHKLVVARPKENGMSDTNGVAVTNSSNGDATPGKRSRDPAEDEQPSKRKKTDSNGTRNDSIDVDAAPSTVNGVIVIDDD